MDSLLVKENKDLIVKQLQGFVGKHSPCKAIIGESGGVDSALITFLCVEALGADRVIARTMPYGDQDTTDADEVAKVLGIKDYGCIDIKPTVDSMKFTDRLTVGNAKARVRMINLYALASENNGYVIGTGNKTEMMLGYFTKYGDGGVDVEPIANIFKTEVFEMAKLYEQFPSAILTKSPSAELWDGQTDEEEIGMTYDEMDTILSLVDRWIPNNRHLIQMPSITNFEEKCEKIVTMIKKSEHKRNVPPSFIRFTKLETKKKPRKK